LKLYLVLVVVFYAWLSDPRQNAAASLKLCPLQSGERGGDVIRGRTLRPH